MKNKGERPKKDIDPQMIEKLASTHLKQPYIDGEHHPVLENLPRNQGICFAYHS